jgi:hypothetical protein
MIDEPSFVEAFYRPLLYLCQIPLIGDLINAYIDLWVLRGVSNWHPPTGL